MKKIEVTSESALAEARAKNPEATIVLVRENGMRVVYKPRGVAFPLHPPVYKE